MKNYIHKIHYYETDKMGIVHNSNYVRWMEEARGELMEQMGFSYLKLESVGIESPVLGYTCEIKHSTHFGENVEIFAKVLEYNGVRLNVGYEMMVDGRVVATGETKHCFINEKGTPIRLNRACPELDEKFKAYKGEI